MALAVTYQPQTRTDPINNLLINFLELYILNC